MLSFCLFIVDLTSLSLERRRVESLIKWFNLLSAALENSKDVCSISVDILLEDINSINLNIVKQSIGLHGVTSGE